MTATNMCSNFGGKWACPPLNEKASKRQGHTYHSRLEEFLAHIDCLLYPISLNGFVIILERTDSILNVLWYLKA